MTNPATTEIERVLTEALREIKRFHVKGKLSGIAMREVAVDALAKIEFLRSSQEPDAYCVTPPDGGCVSADPRCMHQVDGKERMLALLRAERDKIAAWGWTSTEAMNLAILTVDENYAALARVAALRTQQEPEGADFGVSWTDSQIEAAAEKYNDFANPDAPWGKRSERGKESCRQIALRIQRAALAALPTHQAPQAEAVHQWSENGGWWHDGRCPFGWKNVKTRTLYREPAVTAKAQEDDVDQFLGEVRAELVRARAKFPGDRIMTIALAEEFGELCKAILDEPRANVRKEAVQTAVMAARVVLDGDGSVNDWRKERGLDALTQSPKAKDAGEAT